MLPTLTAPSFVGQHLDGDFDMRYAEITNGIRESLEDFFLYHGVMAMSAAHENPPPAGPVSKCGWGGGGGRPELG